MMRQLPRTEPLGPAAGEPETGAAELERLVELADRFRDQAALVKAEVAKTIVGQERVVEQILNVLLAGGHGLLEGVPGLAKTLLVQSLADALSLAFGRVQFTPDLMPADITGTHVVSEDRRAGTRQFHFEPGPVFVNLLLADEINRTPPKTQAALLEAMAEGHVTVAGTRHALPRPFFVLATQNPIEQEGTYPLPEAELDRFLLKIVVDYPEHDDEAEILRRTTGTATSRIAPVLSASDIGDLQRIVRSLHVSPHVARYATRIARASRPGAGGAPWTTELVSWGAGPRAAQGMIVAAKARALLDGRFSVTRGDVRDVALPVLRHRILASFQAEGEGLDADDLVCRLLLELPPFPEPHEDDAATRRILRR